MRSQADWLLAWHLGAMMFLQFAPLGVWSATVSSYIGSNTGERGSGMFDDSFVGTAGLTGALGALAAPLVFGVLADGWFRTERMIALLNVGCAVALWAMCQVQSQWYFFAAMIAYHQCCVPALTLGTSLSLRHLKHWRTAFPAVRALGTGGWVFSLFFVSILAPWFLGVPSVAVESSINPMIYGAVGHLVMALFALTLPRTSPMSSGVTLGSMVEGLRSMIARQPRMLLFLVVSFVATVPAPFYNNFANWYLNEQGIDHAAFTMSWGQIVEILCMLLMPWLLIRWGPKKLYVVGLAAWAVRYFLIAFGDSHGLPLMAIYAAVLLHGCCYTFVYVTGAIYVDHASTPETQGVAQGILAVVMSGFGHAAGSQLSGILQSQYLTPEGAEAAPPNWQMFFLIPAFISLTAIALFGLLMGYRREVMPSETHLDEESIPMTEAPFPTVDQPE